PGPIAACKVRSASSPSRSALRRSSKRYLRKGNDPMNRRNFLPGSVAGSLAALAGDARAQSGPLTKIIFPFAAGGSGDTLCRLLAQHISPFLDRTIIVEDRNGGDGLIGIKAVKGANPDGTTVLITTGPTMFLLPMVETKPTFDRDKDFMPVSLLT